MELIVRLRIKFFKFSIFCTLGVSAAAVASDDVPFTVFKCPGEYVFYQCNNGGNFTPDRLDCVKRSHGKDIGDILIRLKGSIEDPQFFETKNTAFDKEYTIESFEVKKNSSHKHNYLVKSDKGYFQISEKRITEINQNSVRFNKKQGLTVFSMTVYRCEI